MKKAVKIALPLLLIGMMITTLTSNGVYIVTVGNTFVYDVLESNMNVTYGINDTSNQGYELEDHFFPVGSSGTLNVTQVLATVVNYNMSAGAYTEEKYVSSTDIWTLIFYTYSPIWFAKMISVYEWNATTIADILGEDDSAFSLSGVIGYMIHCDGAITFTYEGTYWEWKWKKPYLFYFL